jgi:integrase
VQPNAPVNASQAVDDPWSIPSGTLTATDLSARAWAPATLAAYRDDWNRFATWCHTAAGLDDPLAADDHHVADYVATLVRDQLAFATIRRRLAGITFAFDIVGRHRPPTRSPLVRRVMRGAARTLATAQRRARPLTLDELRQIITHLPILRRDTPRATVERDRLLIGLGWAAALRAGELVALDADDLTFDGPPYDPEAKMTVHLHRSKTDQDGRGDFVIVPYSTHAATYPARLALHAVSETRTGPLFRHIDRHGTARGRLAAAVSRIVKTAVTDVLCRDPTRYSSHSLRAGFITEARRRGMSDHLIAIHTRHRTKRMLDIYDRPDPIAAMSLSAEWW